MTAHSDSQVVIVENQKQLEKFLEVRHELPQVKAIVQMWGEPSIARANENFRKKGVNSVGGSGSVIFAGDHKAMTRNEDEHPGDGYNHLFSSKHGLYSKKVSFVAEMMKPMQETQRYEEMSGAPSVAEPEGDTMLSSGNSKRQSSMRRKTLLNSGSAKVGAVADETPGSSGQLWRGDSSSQLGHAYPFSAKRDSHARRRTILSPAVALARAVARRSPASPPPLLHAPHQRAALRWALRVVTKARFAATASLVLLACAGSPPNTAHRNAVTPMSPCHSHTRATLVLFERQLHRVREAPHQPRD